jgi:hypothetical protein
VSAPATTESPTVAEHTEVEFDESGNQRLTHIVNCPDDKGSTVAWLAEATVMGLEVTALCGHKWVPVRDPKRFPICRPCIEAANILIAESAS